MRVLVAILLVLAWASPAPAQSPPDDAALESRLDAVYETVDGLQEVDAEVSAGIVTLRGEVLSDALRGQAATLAGELDGVLEVQNRLTVSADVTRRLGPAMDRFTERLMNVVYNLPLLLLGLIVLVAAWWFGRWFSRRRWIGRRLEGNPFLQEIVQQLIRAAVLVAAALFVLDLLELTAMVGAVLGAAGLATLAIGFAFRDLIENYIASVLLSLRQPFEPNDLVKVGEQCGRVSRLTSRATVLITPDGNHVRIPNATVFKSEMINYSRNPRRRFEFDVGVDVELELSPVQSLAERTVAAVDGVMADPAPFCLVQQLGDSNVVVRVYGWVDQASHDFARVRSEAIRQVKEAFDQAGIVMPEPIYNIKMLERQTAAAAPQKAAPQKAAAQDGEAPAGADTRSRDVTEREVEKEMGEGENLLDPAASKE
ncbi:MAG: mechanosensitive ion channel family protein [Xanthomonadales bacterium]|nr:mechanosensitive ion channel family protein [Xanthomonadales bacterium]